MTPAIDITAEQRRTILALLDRHLPDTAAWACGSRAKGTSRPTSDLDLVVFAGPEQSAQVAELREAFEESNLPFRVDLFVWDDVSESSRKRIEAAHMVLVDTAVRRKDSENWLYRPLFPVHWNRIPLYSMAQWVNGLAYRNIKFSAAGRPIIKISEIKGGISDQTKFTYQNFDESVHIRAGDLLFSWSGQPETSIDAFWWRGPEGWLNQHIFRVTPSDGIDTTFFFYLLRYLKPNFVAIARNKQTTGLGHVTKYDLENIEAALPDIHEQRTIAHMLGTLDDKIELNRRMNETLEAMARTLFNSWFINFDPVRAKMEGRDTGLPKPIANLFPDRLMDSILGETPEGWAIESLAEHFEAVKGVSYKGSGLGDDGVPLHNLNSIREGGGYKYEGIKYYSGEYSDRHSVRPGDVIVANTEQGHDRRLIGYAALVTRVFGSHGIASHHVYRLRTRRNGRLSTGFLHLLLNSPQVHDMVSGYANGTTVNMLPIDALQRPLVVVPPKGLAEALDTVAGCAEQRRERIVKESRNLTAVRDTLLPKLISGEMRVRDAEKIIGVLA